MASLWQKKSGTWCVTFRENGRQHVRSLRTKDKREALKLKRAVETTLEEHGKVVLRVSDRPEAEHKNPTLDEFWDQFLRWANTNRSRRTVDEYRIWFNQIKEFSGACRLGDITSIEIEEFKAALTKQGKRKPNGVGLEKLSINNGIKTLMAIWSHAIKLNLYTGENPVAAVERFRLPQTMDKDYLQSTHIQSLLDAAIQYGKEKHVRRLEARNVYLAIALMALAGMRKREACFARWEWVDFNARAITVTNDEHFTTKNRRPRIISMNSLLLEILKPFKNEAGYILEASRSNAGKTEYRVDFKKGFQKVCDIAGIQTTPHQLRHSFASRHAVAGTSLHVIAGWLGHSTTWITQRYAHFQKTFNAAADNI